MTRIVVQMNIYQSNNYRKGLSWLHVDDEPGVQEKEQVMDQQSAISVYVVYLTIPSNIQEHQPRQDNSIPCMVVWQIQRDTEQPQGKKLHRTIKSSNILRGSFSNRDNVPAPIQIRRQIQPQHLKINFFVKNRPIQFHISLIKPVKRDQSSFFNIEVKKLLPAPVYSVSQIRFKFKDQFQLLPQIRCGITSSVESSIISRGIIQMTKSVR